MEDVCPPIYRDMSVFTATLQMTLDCESGSFELPRFLATAVSTGPWAASPMIPHPGNVYDAIGALDNTQQKIVILRAIQIGTKTPNIADKPSPQKNQMTQPVARQE